MMQMPFISFKKLPLLIFPFIILLTIAIKVSNIGKPKTINGNTITAAVYVFAEPNIDIIDKENPKNLIQYLLKSFSR